MKTQQPDLLAIRSGTRIRESVRSLPKGHFQQIRQMFDKPTDRKFQPAKKLSTIHEPPSTPVSCHFLLKLPVTDDEKLQHASTTTTTNIDDIEVPLTNSDHRSIEERYRDYLAEYQTFRIKLTQELIQHANKFPPSSIKQELDDNQPEPLKQTLSMSNSHNQSTNRDTLAYTTSLPTLQQLLPSTTTITTTENKHPNSVTCERTLAERRQSAMAAAVNYMDSYEPSSALAPNHLQRTGSTRQYVSSLQQRTFAVHAKPVLVTTTCNALRRNQATTTNNDTYDIMRVAPTTATMSRRLHSSTSLSSTGYDSNSSPSIKSKRNSVTTTNSNDIIIQSTSSSASSSSDEHQRSKPIGSSWIKYDPSTPVPITAVNAFYDSVHSDDAFLGSNEPSSHISRTHIKLSQLPARSPVSTFERRPVVVRHTAGFHKHTPVDSPPISLIESSSSSPSSRHDQVDFPKKKIPETNNTSYTLQTTSFPDYSTGRIDRKIHRWNNVLAERVDIVDTLPKKRSLASTSSTGFQTNSSSTPDQKSFSPTNSLLVQKKTLEREESPLPVVENPIFHPALPPPIPPRKPPRTFEHEKRYGGLSIANEQKTISSTSSSASDSPTFDLGLKIGNKLDVKQQTVPTARSFPFSTLLCCGRETRGARSVSCMDLTAGVSNALLSSGLLPLEREHPRSQRRTSTASNTSKKTTENIYEELKTPVSTYKKDAPQPFLINSSRLPITTDVVHRTPVTKAKAGPPPSTIVKSTMKKGVSEPNLAKTSRSKSPAATFFSPRGLIDRFKKMLPLSLSKQSLNEKSNNSQHDGGHTIADSDDSTSTSSENNDDIRTSRLDHVSRVKNVYDSMGHGSHMSSLFTDPSLLTPARDLTTLFDYVVHIVPEPELGYIANGNGCLSSSNLAMSAVQHPVSSSTSIRFKYPSDANDEPTLKYFCFPDQQDANNNQATTTNTNTNSPLSTRKNAPEYFRFTLTDMRGVRQHGYCSRFVHKGTLNALCIVSPCDMLELYQKILSTATELFVSYKDDDARKFLGEIYAHRLPNRGDTIHISTSTIGLYTLKCEYDRRKELIDSITLLSLSTDTIIKIFSSILYEQKLIFIGNNLGPLTRLINTFTCLLYPFSWPHTYVPVLPALMLDIIQAPTPYIVGILRSCEYYLSGNDDLFNQQNSDVLVVDIDHDRVRSLGDYVAGESSLRGSSENLNNLFSPLRLQILPKIFKIELKQEISLMRKNKTSLSLDECQQRLRTVFMSIFVQSCFNYKDFLHHSFNIDGFIQSKQHTIELFLEWFTRTQIFELFIRQKLEPNTSNQFAVTFDLVCEQYRRSQNSHNKQPVPSRITAKAVKRKAATQRANKHENK